MKTNEDKQGRIRSTVVCADGNSLVLPVVAGLSCFVGVALAVFDPTVSPLPRFAWIDRSPVATAVMCLATVGVGIFLLSFATRLALVHRCWRSLTTRCASLRPSATARCDAVTSWSSACRLKPAFPRSC